MKRNCAGGISEAKCVVSRRAGKENDGVVKREKN